MNMLTALESENGATECSTPPVARMVLSLHCVRRCRILACSLTDKTEEKKL